MFPIIHNISQFDEILKSKPEIKLIKQEVNEIPVGIIHYMIEEENTFDDALSRECRGIAFDMRDGSCISRPFHKFFNVNQNKHSKIENINFSGITHVSSKWDGSLAIPTIVDDVCFWRTKKSFYSPQVEMIGSNIPAFMSYNFTHMYEFVSPHNQIVVPYDKPEIKYLGFRNNETGDYEIEEKDDSHILTSCQSMQDLIEKVYVMEGIEGFVIWDGNDFYKIKTKWYLDRHHAIDKVSYSKAIDWIVNDEVDDIISTLNNFGFESHAKLLSELRNEVSTKVMAFETCIAGLYQSLSPNSFPTRRDYARYVVEHFNDKKSFLFSLYDGKDITSLIKKRVADEMKEQYKSRTLYGL